MPSDRPILSFNKPIKSQRESNSRFFSNPIIPPSREHQSIRFDEKIKNMKNAFIVDHPSGLEVERVLVLEVIGGSIEKLKNAAINVGLRWLAEIDEDEIVLTEDSGFLKKVEISEKFFKTKNVVDNNDESKEIFDALIKSDFLVKESQGSKAPYCWNTEKQPEEFKNLISTRFEDKREAIITSLRDKIEEMNKKSVKGRLFLFMSNMAGMDKLLAIWKKYQKNEMMHGEGIWKNLFQYLNNIRYWGENDRLEENNVLDKFREDIEIRGDKDSVPFELELWYNSDNNKRTAYEKDISNRIEELGGDISTVSFYENKETGIHLAKVNLQAQEIKKLVRKNHYNILFKSEFIKFVRPSGQNILQINVDETTPIVPPAIEPQDIFNTPPIIALLDGLPMENHEAIKDKVIIDDPDSMSENYMAEQRVHGTSMASLICNGDLEKPSKALARRIYVRPIMEPHLLPIGNEVVPENIFFEDIIERSVKRIFEDLKLNVKVINLSVCHSSRWLYSNMTSGGRLLDWPSWKYKVLFCVSAGNCIEPIPIKDERNPQNIVRQMKEDNRNKKILMPADSINAITVGALHQDKCIDFNIGQRIDLLVGYSNVPSPISSFGHGFSSSIKPEILLPGGRQLYDKIDGFYKINPYSSAPGQKTAIGSSTGANEYVYSRGTSNATALATRNVGLIFEMLEDVGFGIPDTYQAVVLKTLLVHGARQGKIKKEFCKLLDESLIKKELSKYLGYGAPDISRVMNCTEKRVTLLGFNSISNDQKHEYSFPLPAILSGSQKKRTLVVTLSWITPVNIFDSKYRVARLTLASLGKNNLLNLKRKEIDSRQSIRGTTQHEILSSRNEIENFTNDKEIKIPIECIFSKETSSINQEIPYALAVTLEIEDDIEIYEKIRSAVMIQETIHA